MNNLLLYRLGVGRISPKSDIIPAMRRSRGSRAAPPAMGQPTTRIAASPVLPAEVYPNSVLAGTTAATARGQPGASICNSKLLGHGRPPDGHYTKGRSGPVPTHNYAGRSLTSGCQRTGTDTSLQQGSLRGKSATTLKAATSGFQMLQKGRRAPPSGMAKQHQPVVSRAQAQPPAASGAADRAEQDIGGSTLGRRYAQWTLVGGYR